MFTRHVDIDSRLLNIVKSFVPFKSIGLAQHYRLADWAVLFDQPDRDQHSAVNLNHEQLLGCILDFMVLLYLESHVLVVPEKAFTRFIRNEKVAKEVNFILNSGELSDYIHRYDDGYYMLIQTWENLQAAQEQAGRVFTEYGFEIPDAPGWLQVTPEGRDMFKQLGAEGMAQMLVSEMINENPTKRIQ